MKAKLLILLSLFIFPSFIFCQEDLSQIDLDTYLNQKGFFLSPINSEKNEGYSSVKQREEFAHDLQKLPHVKKILEIGFNGGHSAETFLNSSDCQKLVSFDISTHPYVRTGVEFMKKKFGDRFEFIQGDSQREIPRYAATHLGEKFDLIFIDGNHAFDSVVADIRNCKQLAHRETFLWFDDYNAEEPKSGVDFCVQEGLITILDSKDVVDSSGVRAWAIGRYQTEAEQKFEKIYRECEWGKNEMGEGLSGPGSTLEQGKPFIDYLQDFLDNKQDIHSVLDVGCGDWVLAQKIDWGEREYLGIDAAEIVIKRNQSRFGSSKIKFAQSDLMTDELPSADLLICKDVLMHLPNNGVFKFLLQLHKFKYCILIHDVGSISDRLNNKDTVIGGFRHLDLTCSPFFLKPKTQHYYISGLANKQIILIEN